MVLTGVSSKAAVVAYWDFDEGTGTAVSDSSGNANNGALVNGGASPWVAGKYGTAIDFNATLGTFVGFADSSTLYTPTALTMMAWIYSRDISRDAPIFAQEGGSTNLGLNFQTNGGSIGILLDSLGTAGWDLAGYQIGGVTTNQWTHLAATWDGTTVKVYRDGVQLPTTFAFSGTLFDSSAAFTLGSNSSSSRFDGLIDDARLYNTALTQSEIQSAMSSPIPEPGRMCLLMVGMVAGFLFHRRR